MTDYDSNFFDKNNSLFKDNNEIEATSSLANERLDSKLKRKDSKSALLKIKMKFNLLKNLTRITRSVLNSEIFENIIGNTDKIQKKEYQQIIEEFLDGKLKDKNKPIFYLFS